MKHLKRINEDWSDDYVYDFKDNGFDVEENGLVLKGQYKGQFVHTQVSSWFEEMLAQMGEEHKVLRTKTHFNELTGNASFEVEIKPALGEHSIEVEDNGAKYKFYLGVIRNFYWYSKNEVLGGIANGGLSIQGHLENGQERLLWIGKKETKSGQVSIMKNVFSIGGIKRVNGIIISTGNTITRGISVSEEDVKKIFDLVYSDKLVSLLIFGNPATKSVYSEMPADKKTLMDRVKHELLA